MEAGLESSKVIPVWLLLGPPVTQQQRTRHVHLSGLLLSKPGSDLPALRRRQADFLWSSYFVSTAESPPSHSVPPPRRPSQS